jgi:hypothetical protein
MPLKPRHFVLIAVIIGLFAFNLWRNRHRVTPTAGPAAVVTTTHPVPVQSPAWSAFDHAAGLRDAAADTFDPALKALDDQLATTHDATVEDLKGCRTWLVFYRQGINHPSTDTKWKDRSDSHLNGCVKFHLDTTR